MGEDRNLAAAERFAAGINEGTVPDDVFTDDFVMENAATAVTDSVYYGARGAQRWRDDLFEAFGDGARFEYEFVEVTPDYAVSRLRIVGEGSASGAPLDMRWWGVLWFRDGRVCRGAGYLSRADALSALGR